MSYEKFLTKVETTSNQNNWMAKLEHKGWCHNARSASQQEAIDNLWEYLVSDICIF